MLIVISEKWTEMWEKWIWKILKNDCFGIFVFYDLILNKWLFMDIRSFSTKSDDKVKHEGAIMVYIGPA